MMILGFAIMGGLITIIAGFSLVNAIQSGGSKVGVSILLTVALLGTVLAIWKLPYWSHQAATPATHTAKQQSQISSQSGQVFSASSSGVTQADNEKSVQQQLAKALTKLGDVTFDRASKTYTLTVTNQDLKQTIQALTKKPSLAKQAKWPRFVENFTKTSGSLEKSLGKGYSLSVRVGHQSPVLVFKDGYVVKNQFE
ncbi:MULTISPECIES: hypothetical protein [Lactobacillaceae]|uniref:hypothetical protein n=1 Tax=Lactobacillaceae TaxID=33958 RepID=UPI001E56BEBF|nr:hypothetical protein [Lactobacillus sp. HBUAS51381]